MNLRKTILSVMVTAACLSIGASVASAVDVTSNPLRVNKDVTTYNARYCGSYANHYAYTQYTGINATKPGYDTSYKEVQYIQYGQRDTNEFYRLTTEDKDGTSKSIYTNNVAVSGSVARRTHISKIHYTSDTRSSVKETFKAFITKH